MEKKIQIELSLEELNEIYYVFGKTFLGKTYALANYELVKQIIDKTRELVKEVKE
jgi:hypothetical protein